MFALIFTRTHRCIRGLHILQLPGTGSHTRTCAPVCNIAADRKHTANKLLLCRTASRAVVPLFFQLLFAHFCFEKSHTCTIACIKIDFRADFVCVCSAFACRHWSRSNGNVSHCLRIARNMAFLLCRSCSKFVRALLGMFSLASFGAALCPATTIRAAVSMLALIISELLLLCLALCRLSLYTDTIHYLSNI